MTIDKAIEILYHLKLHTYGAKERNAQDALKLGIEALKKWKRLREGRAGIIDPLLPGETKD